MLITSAAAGLASIHSAGADTVYTYGNTTGNWSTGFTPTVAQGSLTELSFGTGSSAYTATDNVSGAFTLNELLLNNSAGTTNTLAANSGNSLAFTTGGVISLAGTGGFSMTMPVALNSDFLTVNGSGGGALTMSGAITGSGGITLAASSTLTLSGTNTFSSGINVASGTLSVAGQANLGNGPLQLNSASYAELYVSGTASSNFSNAISITGSSGYAVILTQNSVTTGFTGSISGNGTVLLEAGTSGYTGSIVLAGTSTFSGTAYTWRGPVILNTPSALGTAQIDLDDNYPAAGGLELGGNFNISNNVVTFQSAEAIGIASGITAGITGNISGSYGMQKVGLGQLNLSGTNTYTGSFNVNAGTLDAVSPLSLNNYGTANDVVVFSGATLAVRVGGTTDWTSANIDTLRGAANFSSGSSLGIDTTDGNFAYNSNIGGVFTLTKMGANTLTLNGTSTYTGGTIVSAGTLIPGNPKALGTGTITVAAGTAIAIPSGGLNSYGTFFANVGSSQANATAGSTGTLNLSSTSSSASNPDIVFGNNHSGTSYDGADISGINLGSSQRYIEGYSSHNGIGKYGLTAADCVLAGPISGSGGITIVGLNDTYESDMAVGFVMLGTNTFTGPVIIQGGSLYLGSGAALQGNALSMTPASGDIARFYLYGNNASVSNLTSSGLGSVNIANGTLATSASTSLSAATLTINQTANTTFSGGISNVAYEYSAAGSNTQGNLSIVKNGSASLVLNGSLAYTGPTTINAGTLEIDSPSPTALVTVNSTGTLTGRGTLTGAVNVSGGGTITAGSGGVGNLTVGSLQLGALSGDHTTLNVTGSSIILDSGAFNIATGATSTINVGGSASAFSVGSSYPLLNYSSSTLTSSQILSDLALGTTPNRVLGNLVAGTIGSTNQISFSVTSLDFPVWTGAGGANWNTAETGDWVLNSNNSSATNYQPSDSVLFSDLANRANTTININGADVSPSGVTFNNSSNNYTVTGSNAIAGSTGLVKLGTGSLTLNNTNSFTGGVSIGGGNVIVGALGNSGVNGPLGAGGSISFNGGTLDYTGASTSTNRTITLLAGGGTFNTPSGTVLTLAGQVAGTGNLTVSGPGTLTLGVANSYSGNTIINSGSLVNISIDSNLGTAPASATSGSIVLNGGTLTTNATMTLSSTRGIALGSATGGTGTLWVYTGTLSYSGVIADNGTGPGTLNKIGAGTLSLSGTNTYTGGTNLANGSISLVTGAELGTGPLNVTTSATSTFLTVANNAAVTLPNAIILPNPSSAQTLTIYKNSANSSAGTALTLSGNISGGGANLSLEVYTSASGDNSTNFVLGGSNSFTASQVLIERGEVTVTNPQSLGAATNPLIMESNVSTTLGVLNFAGSFTLPNPIDLYGSYSPEAISSGAYTATLSGLVYGAQPLYKVGSGTLILTNTETYTGGTTVAAGTLQIGNGGATGALPAVGVSVSSGANLAFNRSGTVTFANVISGAGNLVQNGPGTLTLSGTNTFTGSTTVNGGTLQVIGSLAPLSNVAVNSGGILTAPGAIGGSVNVNSGGLLTGNGTNVLGSVTLNNGGSISTATKLTVGGLVFGAVSADTSTVNLSTSLSGSSPTVSQIVDTGAITINSGNNDVTVNISGTPLADGTYQLITYNGSQSALASVSSFTLGTLPNGMAATLVNDTANASIDLNVTAGDYPKWTGALSNEWVTTPQASPHNWEFNYAQTPTDYTDGEAVLFDDTPGNTYGNYSPTVDISSGNVSPSIVTFANNSVAYTITGANGIAGAGGVVMSGTGTVTFSNSNSYTGGTTIKSGTVVLTTSGTAVSGPLGTGGVQLGDTASNGNSATLAIGAVGSSGGLTLPNPITVQSGSTGTLTIAGQNTSGINTLSGNLTITAGANGQTLNVLAATGGELDLSGNLSFTGSGSANLVAGSGSAQGTVKILGTVGALTGTLAVNGGTLQIGSFTATNASNAVTIASGATLVSKGTITLSPSKVDNTTAIGGSGLLELNSSSASLTNPDIVANLGSVAYWGNFITANIQLDPGQHYLTGSSANNGYDRYSESDLTLNGQLSGSGNLIVDGTPLSDQWEVGLYNNNSAWTGNLTILQGEVTAPLGQGLSAANSVRFNPSSGTIAALYIGADNLTIGNLFGTGAGSMYIRNGTYASGGYVAGGNSVLTITQTRNGTFNGVISDGPWDYNGTYTTSYATLGITLAGTANLTLNGSNTYSGPTTIQSGSLTLGTTGSLGATQVTVQNGASLVFASTNGSGHVVRTLAGGLTINSGATVTLPNTTYQTDSQVLATTSFSNSGLLDVGNGGLDLRSSAGYTNIWNQLQSGYNGGTWYNTSGIVSTAAATDSQHLTAVGIIVNDQTGNFQGSNGTALYGTFDGATPADGDILVKFTYYGDTNLSGAVDGTDYANIDNGYLNQLTGWYNGDFNYDSAVDGSDYTLMDNAFNSQGAAISSLIASPDAVATDQIAGATASSSAVPEPTALGLLGVGMAGLLGRRRRRN